MDIENAEEFEIGINVDDRITILFDDGKEKTFDLKVCVRAGSLTLG